MTTGVHSAYQLYRAGRLAEARGLLEQCVRASPSDAAAQFLLGLIELEQGSTEQALERMRGPAAAHLPPASLCQRLGRSLCEQQRYADAERWLNKAVAQDATLTEAHYWLGNARRMRGNLRGAEQALLESIRLAPDRSDGFVALAYLYRDANRLSDAAQAILKLVELCKDDAGTLEKASSFLEQIRRYDLAERLASRILPQRAADSAFLARLGRLREKLGLFDAAADCYRRALAGDPSAAVACLGLSVVRRYQSPDDLDAVLIRQAMNAPEVSQDGRICAHFALGKIFDDCRRYDEAFEHFRQANVLRAAQNAFDRERFGERLRRIRQAFTADAFRRLPRARPRGPTPVFVVGMLRSGTTLVESILAAHPRIFGAGELNHIEAIAEVLAADASPAVAYPECVAGLPARVLEHAADHYRQILAALAEDAPLVVDKNPQNFVHLGLIALLFPEARIIHCRRHPLDVCLSIYCQNFAHGANAYAYALDSIGDVYLEYVALMQHWREHLPLAIFDVDYEALVHDPETLTRRMLDFVGVPFDGRCLAFHRQERPIVTASLWQARQPLYRGSVHRWRNYARHLRALEDRFRCAGVPGLD